MVFKSNIRKNFYHKLENNEKFVTEARMYNEIEQKYKIMFFNDIITICEYLPNGYSKNIKSFFLNNPFGYYNYFKELLHINMHGVTFNKRLYILKHYILFSYLTHSKFTLRNIAGIYNKILLIILFVPGYIKSYFFKRKGASQCKK